MWGLAPKKVENHGSRQGDKFLTDWFTYFTESVRSIFWSIRILNYLKL